ncbi:MAG: zinc-binding dehydrogenase [Actinomycetes bacterium]
MATAGRITPVVTATYPLTGGAKALQAIDDRSATGKAVLLP